MLHTLTIVGGGPGGLAPLFAATFNGALRSLLQAGVTVIERSSTPGAGGLNNITINSDSPAEAFLDILSRSQEPELLELLQHPIAQEIEQRRGTSVPLPFAANLLQMASQRLLSIVSRHPNCQVLTGCEVQFIQRRGNLWEVTFKDDQGSLTVVRSQSVHTATGAHQPLDRLQTELVAGKPLLPAYSAKMMQSGELFTTSGTARLLKALNGIPNPRVVIVGGSTSAGAAAVHLLKQTELPFSAEGVTIMHRSPLRLFYQSVEEAHLDGYYDFSESDICPITGRVFRLSGFRFDSKALLRNALLPNGCVPDTRLKLFAMAGRDDEAQEVLQRADFIIACLGYVPRMCDVRDENDQPIPLHVPVRNDWAVVDQTSTVLTRTGERLDGLTAMGLAIGPSASPDMGGEANFRGQVNSLWLWQNRLGERVAESAIRRGKQQRIPLFRPAPPRLSQHADKLFSIESSDIYSNFGPENTRFEQSLRETFFQGSGACLTTCNATLALMLAIKSAVGERPDHRRYALMPSFTFAAAAQAALWCGLTPLFCDISPQTWLPCQHSENALLERFGDQIAVIVPNATFGNSLDLDRYEALKQSTGIPVVVDAAASLGSWNSKGTPFGAGSTLPIIFSMHATKAFATGEGGVIYSADTDHLERLRRMSFFGFDASRCTLMPGLNAKLSEVAALTASLQLEAFPKHVSEREQITSWYDSALQPQFIRQVPNGRRQVHAFMSILLPEHAVTARDAIREKLLDCGVQTGRYFSPHLAQQEFFHQRSEKDELPVSDDVSARILTLPLFIGMTQTDVRWIADALQETVNTLCLHPVDAGAEKETLPRRLERAS